MADANTEFTNVTSLRSEALGEAGQRTFRILVDSGSSSALMWLEKQQLFQLAVAVKQVLIAMPEGQGDADSPSREREAPPSTYLEFKVGKLTLGLDSAFGKIVIDAHDVESGENDPATLRLWGARDQFVAFAEEALRVCAAGRPLCPLCGNPINPDGHVCARANGHGLEELQDL